MSYLRLSSLQHHLDCVIHNCVLEKETLQDKAITSYALRLEEGTAKSPEFQAEGYANTSPVDAETVLEMGTALKLSNVRSTRFSPKQKNYLMKLFKLGEVTGRKANPMDVSNSIHSARDKSGKLPLYKYRIPSSQTGGKLLLSCGCKQKYRGNRLNRKRRAGCGGGEINTQHPHSS